MASLSATTSLPWQRAILGGWNVSGIHDDGVPMAPHPVPWIFSADHTASAEGHWTARWIVTGPQTISMEFISDGEVVDRCELTFNTACTVFEARQFGVLYRYGRKRKSAHLHAS